MNPSIDNRAAAKGMGQAGSFTALLVRQRLEEHPHFRGRTSALKVEVDAETVIVQGFLPSFYLKQLLQESLKTIPGLARVDNRVQVV